MQQCYLWELTALNFGKLMFNDSALKLSCLWQVPERISGQLGEFYYRIYSLVIVLWWLAKYVQLLWSVSDSCLSELDAAPLTEDADASGNAFSSFILPPVGFLTVLTFSTDPTWCKYPPHPTYTGKTQDWCCKLTEAVLGGKRTCCA